MSEAAGGGAERTFCTIRGPGGELLLSRVGELDWNGAVNEAAARLVAAGRPATVRALLEELRPLGVDAVSAETRVELPEPPSAAPGPPPARAGGRAWPMGGVLAGLTLLEMAWVIRFLGELNDRYSNDGCNELDMDDTPEARRLSEEAFRWATGESRPARVHGGKILNENTMVLGLLRAKLMEFCGLKEEDLPPG